MHVCTFVVHANDPRREVRPELSGAGGRWTVQALAGLSARACLWHSTHPLLRLRLRLWLRRLPLQMLPWQPSTTHGLRANQVLNCSSPSSYLTR